MKKRFGKADVILLLVIFLALVLSVSFSFFSKREGARAVITVEGELYKEVSLTEDNIIEIEKEGAVTNILNIQNGKADMTEADCPDKLCVHQKPISKSGETIVCLPNQVVVEVKDSGEGQFDSIVR